MDYLYLNAIVKEVYKDLPCGCPFPAEFSRNMYSTVSGMDCISNPEIPEVLSFFTLRAKGQSSAMVLSKITRHTNSASVGRFIQSVGWTWNGDLLYRNLDDLLEVGFFSEEEVNDTALRGGSFPLPKDRRSSYTSIPITMSAQVKQAILTTVLLRWLRFEAPLRIAVPKNVDYNSYVVSAMKQIYRFFPVSLRAKAGFCSYLPSDKNVPEPIFIGFIPEEMADSTTLSLDGSSAAACAKLNCGTNSTPLDTFISMLSNASEDALKDFLQRMYEDVEGSGSNEIIVTVNSRNYQAIGSALILTTLEGSLPERVSQWNSKFFNNKDRTSIPAYWQNKIRETIRNTVDPTEFCRLAERNLAAKGFESLQDYQEYCISSPELADALWGTAVAQQIGRKKTYTEIYHHVTGRQKVLAFILDDGKLDRLFQQSVEEQLQALRAKPAQNLKEISSLMKEVQELKSFSETRAVSNSAQLQADVQYFLEELRNRGNGMVLAKLTEGFQQRKMLPQLEDVQKIQAQLDELAAYRKTVAEKSHIPGVEQLLEEMDAFSETLNVRKNDLIHDGYAQRYSSIAAAPVRTVDQIEKVIASARKLMEEVAAAAQIEKNVELRANIQAFVAEKEQEINSSNVKFQEIAKILDNGMLSYFEVLEALHKADKSQLEDHHRLTITDRLMLRRPETLEDYEKAFVACFRKPLMLDNVASLPDYVAGIIARDICQLNTIALRCGKNHSAAENAERIIRAQAIAGRISANHTVITTYDGSAVKDPEWFKNLLLLNHTAETMGDKDHLEKSVRRLVEKNTFSGNEMLSALQMLIRCSLDPMKLFPNILYGDFQNATEQQYRQAFELILQSGYGSPREILQDMLENADRKNSSKAAENAFRAFAKDHTPKKSGGRNKLMVPIICGLGVIIAALIAAVIFLIVSHKEPPAPPASIPTTVVTLPPETEPPVEYPEEFVFLSQNEVGIDLLYGNGAAADFDSHRLKVSELLDTLDEETTNLILNHYSNFHGTNVVIDSQGTTVSWDSYFFWLCWYYTDQDLLYFQEALNNTAPAEPVLSILRVIQQGQPKPDPMPEPVPEETTAAAETVPETTAAAETVPETTAATATTVTAIQETYASAVMEESTAVSTQESIPAVSDPPAADNTPETLSAASDPMTEAETEAAATEETVPSATMDDVKTAIADAAAGSYEASLNYANRLLLIRKIFGKDFQMTFSDHSAPVAAMNLMGDDTTAANVHFVQHYSTLPGDTIICFEDSGFEVTWDEYVFWECWVLAKQHTTVIDEDTFNSILAEQVAEVLTVIHQLVDTERYPDAKVDWESANENDTLPTMQQIITNAGNAFEKAQAGYSNLFQQVDATSPQ